VDDCHAAAENTPAPGALSSALQDKASGGRAPAFRFAPADLLAWPRPEELTLKENEF
jgi:hypothetical protein